MIDWATYLPRHAQKYAALAMANIEQEFPNAFLVHAANIEDVANLRPRALHPAFYGSYDWHSCVEMHWLLIRLLRTIPNAVPAAAMRDHLSRHFSKEALAGEVRFFKNPSNQAFERLYGWAWLLFLMHELVIWNEDSDARHWAENLAPLADLLSSRFLKWLSNAPYPIRTGLHPNTAFALDMALPWAQKAHALLKDAIMTRSADWYQGDVAYPAQWEPSGTDFLSPALTEATLMSRILTQSDFAAWLDQFLPNLADGMPANLFSPALVTDSGDGQLGHLFGLNLSRAYNFRRIVEALPERNAHAPLLIQSAWALAEASLPLALGSHYLLDHWLPAYAVLFLT